jgi:hypothetical protein
MQCGSCRQIFCWHPLRINLAGQLNSEHHGHFDNPESHACLRDDAGGAAEASGASATVSYTSIANPSVTDTHANIVAHAEHYRTCDVDAARVLVDTHAAEGFRRDEGVVQYLTNKFVELRVPERARTTATLQDVDEVRERVATMAQSMTEQARRLAAEKAVLEQRMTDEKAALEQRMTDEKVALEVQVKDGEAQTAVLRSDNALLLRCHELVVVHGPGVVMLQAIEADGRLSATTMDAAADTLALLFTLVPQTHNGALHVALKTFRGKFVRALGADHDTMLSLVDQLDDACLLRCEGDFSGDGAALRTAANGLHVVVHDSGKVNQPPRAPGAADDAAPQANALFRVSTAPVGVPQAVASELCRTQATAELEELRSMRAAGGGGAAVVAEIVSAEQALVAYLATPTLDVAALPPLLKSGALKAHSVPPPLPMRSPESQDLMEGWTGWNISSATCKVEEARLTVTASTPWADRAHQEQQLLRAMGREGQRHIAHAFKVWRVTWSNLKEHASFCAPFQRDLIMGTRTTAAFVMLESGAVRDFWAEGAEVGKWKLCGTHFDPHCPNPKSGYSHNHPYGDVGGSGSMLVALPALVYGFVDLTEPRNWFFFPQHG